MPSLQESRIDDVDQRAGRLRCKFLPSVETAVCVALGALLLWKGIVPGWRVLNTDFPNYYLVARLLREGYSLDRIYDWIWLQRIKDHWGLSQPLVGFAGLTPFSALPIVPLSWVSALAAKRLWIVVNLLLLGSTIELLNRTTFLGRRRIWLLCLLAIIPLKTSFLLGQMHLLVLSLLVLAYYSHRTGKRILCGVCLSIAGALKIYPLLFAVYFLGKRQWRTAVTMLVAALMLLGIGYLFIGSAAMNTYATQILPRSLQGEVLDPYSVHAASAAALLHRLFIFEPTLNPAPWLSFPTAYAVLYPLWQLVVLVPLLALLRQQGKGSEPLQWAALVFALLLLSPVPATYHFVVAIFSIVLLVDFLLARQSNYVAAIAVVLYSAIAGRFWIELLLWGVVLYCLWQYRATRKTMPVYIYALAAVAWAASVLSYHQHFRYLKQDLAGRLPAATPAYLSTGIRRIPGGYLYTAMVADGYRLLDQAGRKVWKAQADQLSAASARNAPVVVVEQADSNGSRLVRMSFKNSAPTWTADGESPAISADGRSVAFIRERKGRGTLWLASPPGAPSQISSYDVRDVSFAPSGWIMFTAKVDGRLSIFSLVVGSQPRVFFSADQDVDSPAVSPDEHSIAFRKLVANRWQLGYINMTTGHERMLTRGDCNAYSPEWAGPAMIVYATDCGRGLGLTALAGIHVAAQ